MGIDQETQLKELEERQAEAQRIAVEKHLIRGPLPTWDDVGFLLSIVRAQAAGVYILNDGGKIRSISAIGLKLRK